MYICIGKSFVILNKTVKSAPLRREFVKSERKKNHTQLSGKKIFQAEGRSKS